MSEQQRAPQLGALSISTILTTLIVLIWILLAIGFFSIYITEKQLQAIAEHEQLIEHNLKQNRIILCDFYKSWLQQSNRPIEGLHSLCGLKKGDI